jgi:FkbM family methyltransferase
MLARQLELAAKLYEYWLQALESPRRLPTLAAAAARGAHLGELLKLGRHQNWLAAADVRSVLDIGAHRGEFSSALRTYLPDASITAFEPLPDCYDALAARMSARGPFRAHRIALGATDGETAFYRSSFSKASSLLPMAERHEREFPWSSGGRTLSVAVRTLDSVAEGLDLTRRCLMKIDVQGAELQVLKGAIRVLEGIDYVVVETSFVKLYEGQADFADVYEFLSSRQFRFAGVWDQLRSREDGAVLQADALFCRDDAA